MEREVISNERGEFWIILLPGTYTLSATHSNKFGTLICEKQIKITNYLSEGAIIEHLILEPRYSFVSIIFIFNFDF